MLRLGLSDAPRGHVINLATGRLTSVRTFAETAARVLSMSPECLEFGALPTRVEETGQGPANLDRLRRAVNWVPSIDIEEGIRRTLHFLTSTREGPPTLRDNGADHERETRARHNAS